MIDSIGNAFATSFQAFEGRNEQRPQIEQGSQNRRSRHSSTNDTCVVDGRWGTCEFTGRCASIIKDWDPSLLGLPTEIIFDEEMEVWGRRWIIKTSTLGERHGYGLFACESIFVDPNMTEGPSLFPFGGPLYKKRHWTMILKQHPEWQTYALELDAHALSVRRQSETRTIDGDPIRNGNIAGFINSTVGTRPKQKGNCEWVTYDGPAPAPYGQRYHEDYVLVLATRTIEAGDELFTHYIWS